jgi:MFS family permease
VRGQPQRRRPSAQPAGRPWPHRAAGVIGYHLQTVVGGPARARVIVVLACVLALSSADGATVGAAAIQLRHALHIDNTDVGLLVAVNSLVAALASLPFGVLADRFRRTRTLGVAILLWAVAMAWSAAVSSFGELLLTRLFLGFATAAAGPVVASLVGDYFPAAERGRIYGYVLAGELMGAGVGFAVTGDIAALSWRAAFLILAAPALVLAVAVLRLPEPRRGGADSIPAGAERIVAGAGMGRQAAGEPAAGAHGGAEPEQAPTDAQRLAGERGIHPHARLLLTRDPRRLRLFTVIRYVLSVRTNVILIVAGTCGYFFLSGVQTFGVEFAEQQYHVAQAVANLLLLVIGGGAVVGVLVGGQLSDGLLRRSRLTARIWVAAIAALATPLLFVPALTTASVVTALPYLTMAGFTLTAQNPPIDAARLDIMPPLLWGRAEGIRTALRTAGQALAPPLFGAVADYVFGGGPGALRWTFIVMLAPLMAAGVITLRARRTYPRDVATAAQNALRGPTGPAPPVGAAVARS